MELLKCPDCGKMVSPRASMCPNCGCPSSFFEEVVDQKTEVNNSNKTIDSYTKKYIIHGYTIGLNQQAENTAYFSRMFQNLAVTCTNGFRSKLKGIHTCFDLISKVDDIANRYFEYAFEDVERYFKEHGVNNIDQTVFLNKYFSGFQEWDTAYESIFIKYSEITGQLEALRQYRELRKDNRGRVGAIGFTFKGYVQASVQAGMINIATGALHGAINAIGNSISDNIAQKKLDQLYNDPATILTLENGFYRSILHMQMDVMKALNIESNIKSRIITDEDAQKSMALVKSVRGKEKETSIQTLIQAIECNYSNSEAYMRLMQLAPESSNDITSLASEFGIDMSNAAEQILINYVTRVNKLVMKMDDAYTPYTYRTELSSIKSEIDSIVDTLALSKNELFEKISGFCQIYGLLQNRLHFYEDIHFENEEELLLLCQEIESFYSEMASIEGKDDKALQSLAADYSRFPLMQQYCPDLSKQILQKKTRLGDPENLPQEICELVHNNTRSPKVTNAFLFKEISKDFDKRVGDLKSCIQEIKNLNILVILIFYNKHGMIITPDEIIEYTFHALRIKNVLEKINRFQIKDIDRVESEKATIKVVSNNSETGRKEFSYSHIGFSDEETADVALILSKCVSMFQHL